ncbi:MAG: ABC transporter substrate-binding protein [Cyanobacteria bacterium J083]|nr:MAG: ABC transporter substrate-binding protein [Cyanobacteria bacterium J083]
MKNNLSLLHFCSLILCLSLISCTSINQSTQIPESISADDKNTTTQPLPEVKRIVTLTSLTTDIIYQLDSTKLVGIPGSRLLQQDPRFTNLPTVSQGRTPPNLEKIIALKPDLVIGARGFSDRTLTKLNQLGIKTISTEVNSWQALTEVTKTLAEAIFADPQPLLASYKTYIPQNLKPQASVLVLVSRQPMLAPNKNSWTGDLLQQFQVKNVTAQLQANSEFGGYVTLSPEKLLQYQPEIILLVDPGQQDIAAQLKQEPFWQELPATQRDRIYIFDYYGLVNPGSLAKIQATCQKLSKILVNSAN